jgi:hypothetical protein
MYNITQEEFKSHLKNLVGKEINLTTMMNNTTHRSTLKLDDYIITDNKLYLHQDGEAVLEIDITKETEYEGFFEDSCVLIVKNKEDEAHINYLGE